MGPIQRAALGGLVFAATVAHAVQVVGVSPQGEVARVRQLVARFDEAAVAFGDPKAPAPLQLSCSDAQATRGTGRWTSEREWVFDFAEDLPPGINCTIQTRAAFKPAKGELLAGQWRFSTGGPFVRWAQPPGGRIDEEQQFLLQLNGDATLASVQERVWCEVEGLGEKVPVRLLQGRERDELLKALHRDKAAAKAPLAHLTFACNRRLAPNAHVRVVYGKGVQTPSGVPNSVERRFEYQVREPFAASFSCERENAQAACLPIRPVLLRFNAPVPRKHAAQVRLRGDKGVIEPRLDDAGKDADSVVESLSFPVPLAERAQYSVELPKDFRDASGRALHNADSFPLKFSTAAMPPLAKFSAAPFGIVERYAEPDSGPLLPVTLRNVEPALRVQAASPGEVIDLKAQADTEIVRWLLKVQRYHENRVERARAQADSRLPLPPALDKQGRDWVEGRAVSLLANQPGARVLELPRPASNDPRPFEVVGIPLAPGFHVVEIASPVLGQSLLDPRYGQARTMYVRTAALVTNLSVHFKLGRENAIAWVTTLDKGAVVPNARVRVSDCQGRELASAVTNAQGVAELKGLDPEAPACGGGDGWRRAYFVSARAKDAQGGEELAFTFSDWYRGIEPWRFNVPTSRDRQPDARYHSVLDRALFRAGETVSMKHVGRVETSKGFGLPEDPPRDLVVTHLGSGQQFTQALAWRKTATGGLSAESAFKIPPAAKLGEYSVVLKGKPHREFPSANFRVEEFRLPVLEGRVAPEQKTPLVAATSVPATVQVNHVAGGAAVNLPVRLSALVRGKNLYFPDYEEFSFQPPRERKDTGAAPGEDDSQQPDDGRVVADKLPVTLDRNGSGRVAIEKLPVSPRARELVLEASYADPNGEVQTLRAVHALWPAAVVVGLKTEGWVSAGKAIRFQAIALGLNGRVLEGVPVQVKAAARAVSTSRKRMVGGFYTYDNQTTVKDLGTVCEGRSDSRGLLLCEATMAEPGEIELVATAKDPQGLASQAAASLWVTRQGELWFGGDNSDRIDVLPEKKSYQPGETAKFQVRMPFRQATALVTVEREGVISSRVMQLRGDDPTVVLRIEEGWSPNVYVSVLVLRGRLREVPWYSLFTWGYKSPREWWHAFRFEGRDYVAPTALVDLSKPAYRLGLAEIRVGHQAHELAVSVKPDKEAYAVRGTARVSLQVTQPNGQPAANAEVALAAVDQALLELMPNESWKLLESMLRRRSWGVENSTAQMEIIGRRHYGRKAVAAGGGGGKSPQRELLDTLLLWNPRVQLDAQGRATVNVPLNDALTAFRIVAVADMGTGLFGTGQATIRATQDLQIISGLPPLVREGDAFSAQLTLRNTTAKPMKVEVAPRATLLALAPQTVDIPAGEARDVAWNVIAPAALAFTRNEAILWELEARDTLGGARDALKASQRIVPAVPLTVQQATLVQLDGPYNLEVALPADAQPGRGGVRLALQPRLAEGLTGVRDWFAAYPFVCLEQKASKAIGLRDARMWQSVAAQLPTYLDRDGLASYFPPRDGESDRGSDALTAYVLAATHEASAIDPGFALPDDLRAPMENGLVAFVEGRIQRNFWAPRKDLDVRKLAAIEALSRYGKAQGRLLGSVTIAPNEWPTSAVIDWLNILRRVQDVPQREQRLAEAATILKARLSYQGTKLVFSTEREDYWWWLMANGDVNTARLILSVLDDPAWKDDMGRLANGFIGRQQRGAWHTTTANLWGGLALEKFSRKFESVPVAGTTRAALGGTSASVDWSRVDRVTTASADGAPHQTRLFGAPAAPGMLRNNAMMLAWPQEPGKSSLAVTQQGTGKPWLTIQSVAAVELKSPFFAGYQIRKTITPVEQAVAGKWSRGDVARVKLEVNAATDMTWVVVSDPIPGGATLLGSGLGRDSAIATRGERKAGSAWAAFEERSFEAFRGYYEYVPKGSFSVEYTMRLNNPGEFALPPTRVEAMYAPEMFGEAPNARVKVEAGR
ncbi:MG2 domain-containing protein [Ramlibacter solisilvae]|uniref:Alpha-2-macroglobulin n=1 Tax=Ramlibacter tataouinensis TaxID=94132 RepID=A0A127JX21_9BURK|nr:MG2 domain-containing protein [Ramlibacter tataouinensis]AMO22582.1 alpha-2-macroglobulin [Ramlibacter tataouinensis]